MAIHWFKRISPKHQPLPWPSSESDIQLDQWYLGGISKDGKQGVAFMIASMTADGRYRIMEAYVDKADEGWEATFYCFPNPRKCQFTYAQKLLASERRYRTSPVRNSPVGSPDEYLPSKYTNV